VAMIVRLVAAFMVFLSRFSSGVLRLHTRIARLMLKSAGVVGELLCRLAMAPSPLELNVSGGFKLPLK
jgi:hypothetical protein